MNEISRKKSNVFQNVYLVFTFKLISCLILLCLLWRHYIDHKNPLLWLVVKNHCTKERIWLHHTLIAATLFLPKHTGRSPVKTPPLIVKLIWYSEAPPFQSLHSFAQQEFVLPEKSFIQTTPRNKWTTISSAKRVELLSTSGRKLRDRAEKVTNRDKVRHGQRVWFSARRKVLTARVQKCVWFIDIFSQHNMGKRRAVREKRIEYFSERRTEVWGNFSSLHDVLSSLYMLS